MILKSPFEANVLQRISFMELDFSFSNLTLYLVLAIIVILVLSYLITSVLSLISNYWQSVIKNFYSFIFSMLIDQAGKKAKVFFPAIFSLFFFIFHYNLTLIDQNLVFTVSEMMFSGVVIPSFSKMKSVLSSSISNSNSLIRRNYSNQIIIDNLFRTQNVIGLDNLVEDSMRCKLIDPILKKNVPVHQLDIMSQVSIKKYGITKVDLKNYFDFNSFFIARQNKLQLAQLQLQYNQNVQLLYQRSNTIAEATALQASQKNLPYLKSINFSFNQNITSLSLSTPLTGNVNPDYACCIVWHNGLFYYYHADLKMKTLQSFENMVQTLHPGSMINTNFYWINDLSFNENYTFSGLTKLRLEDTYIGVINYYHTLDPKLAQEMYHQSKFAFSVFKQTGKAKDYNTIPINTPKFIFVTWIESLFY